MHVVAKRLNGYQVECGCGQSFRVETVRLTFECPRCGTVASAADVISDYLLQGLEAREPVA